MENTEFDNHSDVMSENEFDHKTYKADKIESRNHIQKPLKKINITNSLKTPV